MDDDQIKSLGKLFGILFRDRYGIIQGVEIDIRHVALPPDEWSMVIPGKFDAPKFLLTERNKSPYLWFPWDGKFDINSLKIEAREAFENKQLIICHDEEVYNELINTKSRSSFIKMYVSTQTPEFMVEQGDVISIERVESEKVGDDFEHEHDREIRYAYLRIVRNGNVIKLSTPISCFGRSRIINKDHSSTFFVLCKRISKYFGVADISKVKEYGVGTAASALSAAHRVRELSRFVDSFSTPFVGPIRPLSSDELWKIKYNHDRAVDQAALFGYLWAKAEAEHTVKPLAISALRSRAGASAGGRNSGKVRNIKREATWVPHARQLAIVIKNYDHNLSQDDVATEISLRWKDAKFGPPGHKSLKDLVSEMINSGELPAPAKRRKRRAFT